MSQHAITNGSLFFAMLLVIVAIVISQREKLGLEKEIVISVARAIVQLTIIGYVLQYIFQVNHEILTFLMVLFICMNAAHHAGKRSRSITQGFMIAFTAITGSTLLTLFILVLSGAIQFVPMQVIPITGMIAGNAMIAVGLCYNNLNQRFRDQRQPLIEMLSLGASPKYASAHIVRDTIRAAMIPTVDAAKTVGLVSLPGMMSGLIFAGVDPVQAIKYQIMVTFMLLSTASLSTMIATWMGYRKFYNQREQLITFSAN